MVPMRIQCRGWECKERGGRGTFKASSGLYCCGIQDYLLGKGSLAVAYKVCGLNLKQHNLFQTTRYIRNKNALKFKFKVKQEDFCVLKTSVLGW